MLRLNILTMCLMSFLTFNFGCCNNQEDEQLTVLRNLLHPNKYDKSVRPSGVGVTGEGPTIVETNLYVRDIDFIDERNQMFGVQITLLQKWQDKRLSYCNSSDQATLVHLVAAGGLKDLTLLDEDVTHVWTPDLFFTNDKESRLHNVIKPNKFIRISPSGKILYSSRMSLILSCPMVYKSRFPFDTQVCEIKMASYGYINKEVVFLWEAEDPVQMAPVLSIDKFNLVDFKPNMCNTKTKTGAYSCVKVDMKFSRMFRPYLLNVYFPCCMLVIVAWFGTLLDKKSVTARALIAVYTLYAMTTQVSQMNITLPTTGCIERIESWTWICFTYVFATFAEFVIINLCSRSGIDSDLLEYKFRTGFPVSFAGFCAVYILIRLV